MTDPINDRLNPKAAIGATKPPLHLVPASFIAATAIGLYEGKLKYGRMNWRATDVSASTYVRAALNHITKWFEGQDADPQSTVKELFYAAANLAILIDAEQAGTLVDDRQYPGNYAGMEDELMGMMRRLEEMYGDRNPQHYDRRLVAGPDEFATDVWKEPAPVSALSESMQRLSAQLAEAAGRVFRPVPINNQSVFSEAEQAAARSSTPFMDLVVEGRKVNDPKLFDPERPKTKEEIQALFPNSVIEPVEPEGDDNAQG